MTVGKDCTSLKHDVSHCKQIGDQGVVGCRTTALEVLKYTDGVPEQINRCRHLEYSEGCGKTLKELDLMVAGGDGRRCPGWRTRRGLP